MNVTGFRIGPVAPAGTSLRGSLEECLELLPTALGDEVTITTVYLSPDHEPRGCTMQAVRKPDGEWGFTPWSEISDLYPDD